MCIEDFRENSQQLKAAFTGFMLFLFLHKAPSWIFDQILNMLMVVFFLNNQNFLEILFIRAAFYNISKWLLMYTSLCLHF